MSLMNFFRCFVIVFILSVCLSNICYSSGVAVIPSINRELNFDRPERIEDIARMLSKEPAGIGEPITNRAVWEAIAAKKQFHDVIGKAEKLLDARLPKLTEDLYLEFSRTGNRNPWQLVMSWRHNRLQPLVMAECIENSGRFLPAIESLIDSLCSEPSWVIPAHDKTLENYYGHRVIIDLWSSAFAFEMATADWLLGDRLSVFVTIDTHGEPYKFSFEPIKEETQIKVNRIGIDLIRPVKNATITLLIEPDTINK